MKRLKITEERGLRVSVYASVLLLIGGVVSPGFSVYDGSIGKVNRYANVWYDVKCRNDDCLTKIIDYSVFNEGIGREIVDANVVYALLATASAVNGLFAIVADRKMSRRTVTNGSKRFWIVAQFVVLTLSSFQALLVAVVFGVRYYNNRWIFESVRFPPSTFAYGVAGLVLLANVIIRYAVIVGRPGNGQPTETKNTYVRMESNDVVQQENASSNVHAIESHV